MNILAGVQLFVASTNLKEKELSNFLQRKMRGLYICIGIPLGAVIISTKKFTESQPVDKKKYLNDTLKEILESPWESGMRIHTSSEIRNLLKTLAQAADDNYEEAEDKNHEAVGLALVSAVHEYQYKRLKTNHEKALWLNEHRDTAIIFKRGERFIEENIRA